MFLTPTQSSTQSSTVIQNSLVEMTERAFTHKFRDAKKLATDEDTSSTDESITSWGVDDCITIFGMQKKDGKITEIIGFHIASHSTVKSIVKRFEDYVDVDEKYDLFFIGGNDKSTQEGDLLDNVEKAIEDVFGSNGNVLNRYLNLNKGTSFNYIDANIQMDGTLTFCRYRG